MAGSFDPARHHRRSIRLSGYDYAQAGAYVVTICSHQRRPLLAEIVDGTFQQSTLGKVVEAEWLRTSSLRPQVLLDAYVVMPNHFHGLVLIQKPDDSSGGERRPPSERVLRHPSQTLGAMIRGYKAASTKGARTVAGDPGLTLWQSNYYEHIVRDERSLDRARGYIADNVRRWAEDRYRV